MPEEIPHKQGHRQPERQQLSYRCGACGHRATVYIEHYGKTYCKCGLTFWALQPRKGGPLKLFIHPTSKGAHHSGTD